MFYSCKIALEVEKGNYTHFALEWSVILYKKGPLI